MVYLDNASTTSVDPFVIEAMMPYFNNFFFNASSKSLPANILNKKLQEARVSCAELINANPEEIIFTSGATESINFALKGYIEENFGKGNHIVTSKTEHKAVLKTCEYLETKGIDVTYLDVNRQGEIIWEQLEESITEQTSILAFMLVNNETGVINDIKRICKIAKKHGIVVFCDATQAIGKLSINVHELGIDMLCMSAHKINGPKGVGFLYVREGIKLTPLIHGGSQENDMRGGTYNTPLIIGLGKASEIVSKTLETNRSKYKILNEYLINNISSKKNIEIISESASKVDNIINLKILGLDANIFVESNKYISVSNGSACTSRLIEGSHVLKAMGYTDQECNECIRVSFNKLTTLEELDILINELNKIC